MSATTAPSRVRRSEREARVPVGPVVALIRQRIKEYQREQNPRDLVLTASNGKPLRMTDAKTAVCRRLGIDPRSLYAWEHGERTTVPLATVDAIVIEDGRVLLHDLYPELA
jgi:hypothetical protein